MKLITTRSDLVEFAALLASGYGPVALDAERASGYRYSQRAYLVQIHRRGAGTGLIDPIEVPDLSPIAESIAGNEWILHAATQDLPCLAELGLYPEALFDTELAGRLLGRERVNLAALVEEELGVTLTKGYGAADWSVRPLSAAQVQYAALDVVHLPDLRDRLADALAAAMKADIAAQEFAALVDFRPKEPGPDPWRRLSGIHRLRTPVARGIARELWLARDEQARLADIAPGRILRDRDIIEIAQNPASAPKAWQEVVTRATPVADATPASSEKTPPTKSWAEKRPEAAARWQVARPALLAAAADLMVPVENLMSPGIVRDVLWNPPADPREIPETLRQAGARPWQIEVVAPLLNAACEPSTGEVTGE